MNDLELDLVTAMASTRPRESPHVFMGPGFPFGGESTGVGAGPMVNAGAGMPGAGGEDVGFGVPHSHKTTPGGGVAAEGY